jgi:flagellar hook-length control protein FliK
MSISAISGLIAASGGKTALSALGEILPDTCLPLDFAALLAEQIPGKTPADPSLLVPPVNTKTDSASLGEIISQPSLAADAKAPPIGKAKASTREVEHSPRASQETAESVLAALSAKPATSVTPTVGETEGKKDDREMEQKVAAAAEPVEAAPLQIDPSNVAQYVVPPVSPPVQSNRLPQGEEREKPSTPGQTRKTGSLETAEDDDRSQRPDLPTRDVAPPPAPAAQSAKPSETRIPPRSETANAAILAGDAHPGNSGNTPAFATALAATTAANGTATATATAPPTQTPAVTSALHSPNWSQDFGNRVVWLAKNDQQVAQININPPQLGPVQISISINGDQATTVFASPHAEVRQAIQDSLPQLREMFSTAGINLGQANVGSQLPSQNREAAFQFANEARSSRENAILSPDSHASSSPAGIPIQRGRGLVDLFA